ncbi:MAG: hypothetical protein ACM3KL_02630 [Alphaproteobacteria bacterium]
MNLFKRVMLSIIAILVLLVVTSSARAQVSGQERDADVADTPTQTDAVSFRKKATEAQVRIHANKADRDELMRAIKTNEVPLAKEVLLRNGFTAEDLQNAKIILRTGGGTKDEIEISATCCNPKEITIQRSLDYFIK